MSKRGIGSSRAQVDTVFRERVTELQQHAQQQAAAVTDGEQRRWQMPTLEGWAGDTLDVIAMEAPFDRAALAANHQEVIRNPEDPGTVSDLIALKLQSDYLACLERAFRTRHRTSVRSRIHAAARRRGHGDQAGIFVGGVLQYISNIIRQGSSE